MSETLTPNMGEKPPKSKQEVAEQIGRISAKLYERAAKLPQTRAVGNTYRYHGEEGGDFRGEVSDGKKLFVENNPVAGKTNIYLSTPQDGTSEDNKAFKNDLVWVTKDADGNVDRAVTETQQVEKADGKQTVDRLETVVDADGSIVASEQEILQSAQTLSAIRGTIAQAEIDAEKKN